MLFMESEVETINIKLQKLPTYMTARLYDIITFHRIYRYGYSILDPDNLNLVILNSSLSQSQNHFP